MNKPAKAMPADLPPVDLSFDETCVPRRVLELFSVKWTSMVLYALHHGTMRPGELQRALPGISKKMLTQTLRELEADGLICRKVHPVMPPCVHYSLTPFGRIFIEPLQMLYAWGTQHADELEKLSRRRKQSAGGARKSAVKAGKSAD